MNAITFKPTDDSQLIFLEDFAKRIRVPYYIVPLQDVPTKRTTKKRVADFEQLQESLAGCTLTDEEIRQECELVRSQLYEQYAR